MRGCDVAWGVIPGREREFARALKRRGFGFIVRYLCADPTKRLTRAEVRAYKAEGIHIVTVYEDAADALLGGEPAGHAQAVSAKQQLGSLGAPAHAPVYFAADFQATSGQIPVVDQALDGTALVLTEDLNGVYGEYALMTGAKHVRYKWQTAAWSAGVWSPDDEIRQFAISGNLDGVSYDLDESMVRDFGQWVWPKEPPLTPPAPKPKKHIVKRAAHKVKVTFKKTPAAAKHKVKHEPVVVHGVAAGGLMAAIPLLAKRLQLTPVEVAAIMSALPALAALLAAFRVKTEHAFQVAVAGLAAAGSTAAAAFGYAIPLHTGLVWLGASAPAIAAVLAWVVRQGVTPKAAVADVEQMADTIGSFLDPASTLSAAPPVAAPALR